VLAYPFLNKAPDVNPDLAANLAQLPHMLRFPHDGVDFMYPSYLCDIDRDDARFASLDGNSLIGFLETLVIVSEYDDLRPSGEEFARQAASEGVSVHVRLSEGMLHGHLNRSAAVPEVDASLSQIAEFIAGVR
jgi:acetyl esterase